MEIRQKWSFLAAAAFAASQLAGCGAEKMAELPAKPAIYTAGSYSGTSQGYGGTVTVEITVDSSAIISVKATGAEETPEKGGAALAVLEGQILEKQSAEIDGVTGATRTSDGIREAAATAIKAAKGEPAPTTQPITEPEEGGETVSEGAEQNEEMD